MLWRFFSSHTDTLSPLFLSFPSHFCKHNAGNTLGLHLCVIKQLSNAQGTMQRHKKRNSEVTSSSFLLLSGPEGGPKRTKLSWLMTCCCYIIISGFDSNTVWILNEEHGACVAFLFPVCAQALHVLWMQFGVFLSNVATSRQTPAVWKTRGRHNLHHDLTWTDKMLTQSRKGLWEVEREGEGGNSNVSPVNYMSHKSPLKWAVCFVCLVNHPLSEVFIQWKPPLCFEESLSSVCCHSSIPITLYCCCLGSDFC